MNHYVSEEEQKAKDERDDERARYTAQISIANSLNTFIKQLEKQKEHAEQVLNWVQADKWRDHKIQTLEGRMKRLEEQGKRIEECFNSELRTMRSSLSSHKFDDFDWSAQVMYNSNLARKVSLKVLALEKENKLLMTKMLELEQRK